MKLFSYLDIAIIWSLMLIFLISRVYHLIIIDDYDYVIIAVTVFRSPVLWVSETIS